MLKSLSIATLSIAATGLASAAPLPAPPTEAYTAPAANDCASETLHVYFPAGTSALTPASRALLDAAQSRLADCVVGEVSLNATAADARNAVEAERLTQARIETISAALVDHELDGMRLSADAPVEDAHALWTPMDRKVEIRLAAWSPEIS